MYCKNRSLYWKGNDPNPHNLQFQSKKAHTRGGVVMDEKVRFYNNCNECVCVCMIRSYFGAESTM